MPSLAAFLERLLRDGEVVLREKPRVARRPEPEAREFLERAYAEYRLEVASPLIDFDAGAALAAGELVRQACWFLVNRDEPAAELMKCLVLPGTPTTPAQHLSADLVLRFLPQVHRRARSLAPDDQLPGLLAEVLRRWPLTGVLAEVEDGPLTPVDFAGHPGLLLLYAERLAQNERPAWMPGGAAREYVELVFAGLGKEVRSAAEGEARE
jgi:hypothetical protein